MAETFKNGDWITQSQAMQIYGCNRRRLIYLVDCGELEDNGKERLERRIKYVEGFDANALQTNREPQSNANPATSVSDNGKPLTAIQTEKLKYTIAQRKKLEQQLTEGREVIKAELMDEVLTVIKQKLIPLETVLSDWSKKLGATTEQVDELREAWKQALTSV